MRLWFGLVTVLGLAACVVVPEAEVAPPEIIEIAELDAPAPPPEARRIEEFDTTTQEQRIAALESDDEGVLLGEAVLSLGDPGRAGFWVETAFVSAPAKGRVELRDGTKSIEVAILPTTGSGRISLAALRLLDVPSTALVEVNIFESQ